MDYIKNIKDKMTGLNKSLELEQQEQKQITETVNNKVVRIRSFQDYAIQKAGLNNGDSIALKANLQYIKDGYIVDETYNEKDHQLFKQKIQQNIKEKSDEKELNISDKNTVENVHIPSSEEKINALETEIQQTQLDLEADKIITGYQSIKHYMYVTLVIILSAYLILFYASTIYSSFFRSAGSLIATAGDDIVLYLNTIFDVKGIFTPSFSLIFVYLGAFLFFAIGLIPHTLEGKYSTLKKAFVIIGALAVDSLLAYKIDLGIHELKEMAGMADENWFFLSSVNFYLVLAFGFLAYLVWGYMFGLMLKEKDKKNAHISTTLIIKGFRKEIKQQQEEIKTCKAKIISLETKISILSQDIEQLKKDLERAMLNPDLLSQSLTSFYMGWLQFLNSSIEFDPKKSKCEIAYSDFMNTHFKSTPILN